MKGMKGYAKRGGGKVAKLGKVTGGGPTTSRGKGMPGVSGDSYTPGGAKDFPESMASFGPNAKVRETRLPGGGCPKGSKASKSRKRMKY